MPRPRFHLLRQYGVSVLLVGTTFFLRLQLQTFLGPDYGLMFYFPAVMAAGWFGGRGPGIVAALISALSVMFLWIHEQGAAALSFNQYLHLTLFFLITTAAGIFVAETRRALGALQVSQTAERRERERYQTTLASIGDAVIATDAEGRITFMNSLAERLTGWSFSTARGRGLSEVFVILQEETRVPIDNPVRRVLQQNTTTGPLSRAVLVSQRGTEFPIEDNAAPIREPDGSVSGAILVFHDTSDRRAAERQVEESETRFRIMADAAPVLIWMTDTEGACDWFNRPWLEFTGRTLAEEIGEGWQASLHPDDVALWTKTYREAFERRGLFSLQYRRKRADGAYRWMLVSGRPRLAAGGEFAGYIGSCVDVTELREIREGLEQKVRERTAELNEKVFELETFSYSMSHDLRTPLRAISGYSEILLENLHGKIDPTDESYLERVMDSAKRLDRLVVDVLSYSKVVREPCTLQTIDLSRLVHELVELSPPLRCAQTSIHILEPLGTVKGNEALLTQCITNLLSNAVKFAAPDRDNRVTLRAERRAGWIRICVEDSGIGIEERDLSRIFDLFERVNPNSHYEGTGIGLAVVKKAAERMGGKVGVQSRHGTGSKFWIELQEAPTVPTLEPVEAGDRGKSIGA